MGRRHEVRRGWTTQKFNRGADGDGTRSATFRRGSAGSAPDVPVGQFWALTLYSENTRRPYDNGGETKRSVNLDSSLQDLKYNDDGSVDLFIGPRAPTGYESNFMKTVGEDGWFVYFRLYAPLEPFFDKSFRLPDFEPVES